MRPLITTEVILYFIIHLRPHNVSIHRIPESQNSRIIEFQNHIVFSLGELSEQQTGIGHSYI